MRVLISEDDPVSRRVLGAALTSWGFEVVATEDGEEALAQLMRPDAPALVILDWMMPRVDGLEVCRRLREAEALSKTVQPAYVIMLTAKGSRSDVVTGLSAGADDYLVKPYDRGELKARIAVGIRLLALQKSLADRLDDLESAMLEVKRLQGMLPICSYCKKIRCDDHYWQQIDTYITEHSEATFSHGICPDCYLKIIEPQIEKVKQRSRLEGRPEAGLEAEKQIVSQD